MANTFSETLSVLRKEQNLSQKQAAQDLGVSQALLSHYEKGIRECGLDFLCRAATYYGVSADYLLGRTTIRATAAPADPSPETDPDNIKTPSLSGHFARISRDSLTIVFALLEKINSDTLTREVAAWLAVLIGEIYRMLNRTGSRNPGKSPETIRHRQQELYLRMALHEHRCRDLLTGSTPPEIAPVHREQLPALTRDLLLLEFKEAADSLYELLDITKQPLPFWVNSSENREIYR